MHFGSDQNDFPARSKRRGHPGAHDPAVHVGALIRNVFVVHVLRIQGQGDLLVQAEPDIPFHHLALVHTRVPAIQVAISDTDFVLLPAPQLAADVHAP